MPFCQWGAKEDSSVWEDLLDRLQKQGTHTLLGHPEVFAALAYIKIPHTIKCLGHPEVLTVLAYVVQVH